MKLRTRARLAAAAVTACAATLAGLSAGPASAAAGHPAAASAVTASVTASAAAISPPCAVARARTQQCFLSYRPQTAVNRAIAQRRRGPVTRPKGWSPRALESAYRLPVQRRTGETVAVSIPYNTPHLARFLSVYRQHYGLPPCTTGSGCSARSTSSATRLPCRLPARTPAGTWRRRWTCR